MKDLDFYEALEKDLEDYLKSLRNEHGGIIVKKGGRSFGNMWIIRQIHFTKNLLQAVKHREDFIAKNQPINIEIK